MAPTTVHRSAGRACVCVAQDYGYTWAAHLKRLKLTNYLVGAMDGEALTKLVRRAIPTFDMESGLSTLHGPPLARRARSRIPCTHPAHRGVAA